MSSEGNDEDEREGSQPGAPKETPPNYSLEHYRQILQYHPTQEDTLFKKFTRNFACNVDLIFRFLPVITWIRTYKIKEDLFRDIIAGVTVALIQMPQGLLYAPLALQAPVVGLNMATFPSLMYMIVGTSRHISLGQMAMVTILVGNVVQQNSITDEDISRGAEGYSRLQAGITVCFTVGLWQLVLGLLQLGHICVIFSHVLISSYTSGAGIYIVILQMNQVFGMTMNVRSGPFQIFRIVQNLFENIWNTNHVTFSCSLCFMISHYLCLRFIKPISDKKMHFPLPYELFVIALATGISIALDLNGIYNVAVVGPIQPSNLPTPLLPVFVLMPRIAMDCFFIALEIISMNISIGTLYARKGGYNLDNNQELRAIGVSNMFGSFFHSMPACASFSRTAIQFSVGARTQLSHGFMAMSLLLFSSSLGFVFESTPLCVLTVIPLVYLTGLCLQLHELPSLWQKSRLEGMQWLLTFVCVLLDVDYGLAVGVGLSILNLLFKSCSSDAFVVAETSPNFVDLRYYPVLTDAQNLIIIKVVGALHFVTASLVQSKIEKVTKNFLEFDEGKEQYYMILDMSSVPHIDPSSVQLLLKLYHDLLSKKCNLSVAGVNSKVYQTMEKCDFFKSYSKSNVIVNINEVVHHLKYK